MNYFQNSGKAIQAVKECLVKAQNLYGLSDSWREGVDIEFRNMGRTGGTASIHRWQVKLSFNEQLLSTDEYMKELLDVIIPHEVAHIVCYEKPTLGRNHNRGWQRVCIALGGTGDRTHDMPLQKARRTRQAIYEVAGNEIPLGMIRHKKIQEKGVVYRCNYGKIKPENFTGRIVVA